MHWLIALNAAGGAVLATAGIAKLRRPAPTATALAAMGGRRSELTVRVIGLVEVSVGVAGAVAGGSWFAWVLAVDWLALGFAAIVLLRRPHVPCGCFGEAAPTPVGAGHVLVNLTFAGCAVATATAADGDLGDALAGAGGGPVVAAIQIAVVAYLVRALLTDLPALRATVRAA